MMSDLRLLSLYVLSNLFFVNVFVLLVAYIRIWLVILHFLYTVRQYEDIASKMLYFLLRHRNILL